jgi:hypothetical protein
MIFFTAGAVAQRTVAGHTPNAITLGIWSRSALARYLPLLRDRWQPLLDGRGTFAAAIAAVVGGIE